MARLSLKFGLTGIFLIGLTIGAGAVNLEDIRYADHENYFRFVLDLSELPKYRLVVAENSPVLIVEMKETRIRCEAKQEIAHANSPVSRIVSDSDKSDKGSVRFYLKDANVRPKYFTLTNPNRLVIDFYRAAPDLSRRNFKVVVIDPGHGGWDAGAQRFGLKEKDIVLDISRRLEQYFRQSDSFQAYLTRETDSLPFLTQKEQPDPNDQIQRNRLRRKSLQGRVNYANQLFQVGGAEYMADLFVSIHVNAARNRNAHGFELFIPGDKIAHDEMTRELLAVENAEEGDEFLEGLRVSNANRDAAKVMLSMMSERMKELNPIVALHMETQLKKMDKGFVSRGIKQGPFQVLRQMRMPAILVEVGFVSNRNEAQTYLSKEWFRQWIAYCLYTGINNYFQEIDGFQPDRAAPPRKPKPEYNIYTVRKGDSLDRIGRKFRVSYLTIKQCNQLRSDIILPGQKLKIPVK